MNQKKLTTSYIMITFLMNSTMIAMFALLGGKWEGLVALIIGSIYMLVPMGVSLFIYKFIIKKPVAKPLGISFRVNKWFLAAWLIPPLIAFLAFSISLLIPGVRYTSDMSAMFLRYGNLISPEQAEIMIAQMEAAPIHPVFINLITGLIAGTTINAVFAFGEELGWRGFLQNQLRYMGFWKSSLVIGSIWGIWHAPIILMGHNYPQHPVIGVFMMTIGGIVLSPIFSYIRIKAKSVIAASIMHGTFNATAGLAVMLIAG